MLHAAANRSTEGSQRRRVGGQLDHDAAWSSELRRAGTRSMSHSPDEHVRERGAQRRMSFEGEQKGRFREGVGTGLFGGDHHRRHRHVGEQRHLAEDLARAEVELGSSGVARRCVDGDGAARDGMKCFTRLASAANDRAGREIPRLREIADGFEGGGRQRREKRKLRKVEHRQEPECSSVLGAAAQRKAIECGLFPDSSLPRIR